MAATQRTEVVFHRWCPWPLLPCKETPAGRRGGTALPCRWDQRPDGSQTPLTSCPVTGAAFPLLGAVWSSTQCAWRKRKAQQKERIRLACLPSFSKGQNSSLISWKATNPAERVGRTRLQRRRHGYPPALNFLSTALARAPADWSESICHWSAAPLDFVFLNTEFPRSPAGELTWNKASCWRESSSQK